MAAEDQTMLTREALELAFDALTTRASETDTASPEGHETRLALVIISAMLTRRIGKDGDEFALTTLCDVLLWDE